MTTRTGQKFLLNYMERGLLGEEEEVEKEEEE